MIPTVLTQLQFVKMTTDVEDNARRTMSVNNGITFAMISMTTVTIVVLHQIVMTLLDVAPVLA